MNQKNNQLMSDIQSSSESCINVNINGDIFDIYISEIAYAQILSLKLQKVEGIIELELPDGNIVNVNAKDITLIGRKIGYIESYGSTLNKDKWEKRYNLLYKLWSVDYIVILLKKQYEDIIDWKNLTIATDSFCDITLDTKFISLLN